MFLIIDPSHAFVNLTLQTSFATGMEDKLPLSSNAKLLLLVRGQGSAC